MKYGRMALGLAAVLLAGAFPAWPGEIPAMPAEGAVQTENTDIEGLLREFHKVRYGGWSDFAPAFRALGDAAVDAVRPLLRRPETGEGAAYRIEWNQRRVAWVLGAVGSEKAIGLLLDMLDDETLHPSGRLQAVRELGRLGDERAVDPLLRILIGRINDSGLRRGAALAFRDMKCERAVPALLAAARDPEGRVRMGAISALGRIATPEAVEGLDAALEDPDGYIRQIARDRLIELQPHRRIDLLVRALADVDWGGRERALRQLVETGECAVARLRPLLRDLRAALRLEAARALGRLGAESAVGDLAAALRDPDWMVANQAAVSLAGIGGEAAVRALIPLLDDDNPRVRVDAAWALGELRAEAAVPALIEAVTAEASGWMAAFSLGRIGAEEAAPALIAALRGGEIRRRRAAARSLALISSPRAKEALSAVLGDHDPEVRLWVARGLAK